MAPQASNSTATGGDEDKARRLLERKRPKRIRHLLSLRTVLTVPNVLLICLAIITVGYFSFRNGQAAVNDAAQQFRMEIAENIRHHLDVFLDAPIKINEFNEKVIQAGELDPSDTEAMQRFFLEEAKIYPSISSIYFGNTEGGLIGSGREGAEGWLYVTSTVDQKSGEFQKFRMDEAGQISPTPLASIPNFDARTRPWYTRAKERESATWSDIYILFTGQDMALAASKPVYDKEHQLIGVVSVDIFLSQLSDYLEGLSINSVGQVFIMERSGALVAASNGEALFQDKGGIKNRVYANQSQSDLIREAGNLLVETYGGYAQVPNQEQHLVFTLHGEKQFLQYLSVSDPYGINWIVVMIIPESAFMERIEKGNQATLFAIMVALMVAIGLSVFITARISRRISHLGVSAQELAAGEWTHELDTSTRIIELNHLAITFNRMKKQLGSTLDHLIREVKERQHAEQALEEEVERRRILFEESPDGILIIDPITTRFLEFNTAAHQHLGYTREEFEKLSILDVDAKEKPDETRSRVQGVIESGMGDFETLHRTKQGDLRNIHVTAKIISMGRNQIYYCVWRDITERKRIDDALRESEEELIKAKSELEATNHQLEDAIERERLLARIDELTGVHNRRHLFEVGTQKIAVAYRYRQPLAALMIDIDHFKNINDQFGHILGDKILMQVSKIASENIRSADTIGRYGGEEFIIIMPMTTARQAYLLAERIRSKVEKTHFHSGQASVSITLSIGVAELNLQVKENAEDLFHRADEAMYEAKRAGRNRSAIYK